VEIKEEITAIIRNRLQLPEKASRFTDIRHTPHIPLRTLILCFALMPFYGIKSLLRLDFLSRKDYFKNLFGQTAQRRKMVCSDSTLQRIARWIKPEEAQQFQLAFLEEFLSLGAYPLPLVPGCPSRRIGILDGSFMGGHFLAALTLFGTIRYPVLLCGYANRGRELEAAKQLILAAASGLGPARPELLLLDSLYFNAPIFSLARSLGFHVLVKSSDPSFRTVLQDAQFLFALGELASQQIQRCTGFDSRRLCSWTLEMTSGTFAGFPLTVAHLRETFSKQPGAPPQEAWIVTTDLSFSPAELREAAYARWSIENDVFKKLSHLAGTKRFHFKDPSAFLSVLRILCAAVTAFELAIFILNASKELFKAFRDGIKPTVCGLFSRLADFLENSVFA